MLLMFARAKPLRCVHLMLLQVLEAYLNLLVLQRGNLLMLYAVSPLVLTVPRWMLDFRHMVWIRGTLSILRCSAEDVWHLPLVMFICWFIWLSRLRTTFINPINQAFRSHLVVPRFSKTTCDFHFWPYSLSRGTKSTTWFSGWLQNRKYQTGHL